MGLCIFLSWFRQDGVFTGEGNIMERGLENKNILMMDLFITNKQLFASQDVNWWTGVMWITCGLLWCFNQLFELSFWWHPFTAEVSKQCNTKILQIWNLTLILSRLLDCEDKQPRKKGMLMPKAFSGRLFLPLLVLSPAVCLCPVCVLLLSCVSVLSWIPQQLTALSAV